MLQPAGGYPLACRGAIQKAKTPRPHHLAQNERTFVYKKLGPHPYTCTYLRRHHHCVYICCHPAHKALKCKAKQPALGGSFWGDAGRRQGVTSGTM